jgi:phenylacetate-coenzyme A ligase PaaK-like adenylate-forming protein
MRDLSYLIEKANRPPNLVDYILAERFGERIPEDEKEYLSLIRGYENRIIDEIISLQRNGSKIDEALLQPTVLYAVEFSEPYREKYKRATGKSGRSLRSWIQDSICSPEDIKKLPTVTNSDLRSGKYNDWWIKGKRVSMVKASGGSTGKPVYVAYSPVDEEVVYLLAAAGLKESLGDDYREGITGLIHWPGESHPVGTVAEIGLKMLGCTPIYKHMIGKMNPQYLIEEIVEINPELLFAAPIGPKGIALESLLQIDMESDGRLKNALRDKIIFVGGAPTPRELVEILYEEYGVKKIINGYGSAQCWGYFDGGNGDMHKTRGKRNDGVNFFSDIKIPNGYWLVTEIETEGDPEPWHEIAITVYGREAMPIIHYQPGDYAKIVEEDNTKRLKDICRKEWFVREGEKYKVKLPSQVFTCISEV